MPILPRTRTNFFGGISGQNFGARDSFGESVNLQRGVGGIKLTDGLIIKYYFYVICKKGYAINEHKRIIISTFRHKLK